jgi:hypothetical protein
MKLDDKSQDECLYSRKISYSEMSPDRGRYSRKIDVRDTSVNKSKVECLFLGKRMTSRKITEIAVNIEEELEVLVIRNVCIQPKYHE